MNCSNCGSSLVGSESVCPYCGKPLDFNANVRVNDNNDNISTSQSMTQVQSQDAKQSSLQENQQQVTQSNIQSMNNKKSNNKNTLLIVAFVVIIILLAICVYLFISRNNNVTGEKNQVQSSQSEDTDNSIDTLTCTRQNSVLDASYEFKFANDKFENFAFIYTLKNMDESIMTETEANDFILYALMYLDLTKYKDDTGVIFSANESDVQIKVEFEVEISKASKNLKSDLLVDYENKGIEEIKTQFTNDGFVCN